MDFPLIFTVYIDELHTKVLLAKNINGYLNYADDLVLLCYSVKGLQRMVDLCSEFGLTFSVTYNAKKIKYMKFELKPVMPKTYTIRFEGNVLEWTTSIKK